MARRLTLLAALLAAGLLLSAATPADHALALDACGGVPYGPPANPRVVVEPEIYAGQPTFFRVADDATDSSGPIEGSVRFAISGPAGRATVPGDRNATASYTPPNISHYTVAATWRQFACADGDRTTYYDVSTPATGFDALAGKQPKAAFRTRRRPKAPNRPGDATLLGFLVCPAPSQARSDNTSLAVYYQRGTKKPSHASPHLRLTVRGGCDGRQDARPRRHQARSFYLSVNRDQVQATVTAPARLRVLLEIKVAGKLLGRAYGRFAPSSTGESVRRS